MIEKNGLIFQLWAKYVAIRVIECAVVLFYFMDWYQEKDEKREGLTLVWNFMNFIQVRNRHFEEPQKSMVLWWC